ncbi:MAG: fatty acid desaturase [Planctomycetota bacterium]
MSEALPPTVERLPAPDLVQPGEIRWGYARVLIGMHALALLAAIPWLFSWTGLIAMVLGVHVFGQAINLCYHRLLAHKSAKVPKWLEHAFVIMGLCCLEETPGKWVAIHRYHHKHSDHQEDPHSPLVAFAWSHVLWMVVVNKRLYDLTLYTRYAPDVLKDRFYMNLEKRPKFVRRVYVIHALIYFAVGLAIGWARSGMPIEGLQFGLSLLVWGVIVRTVVVWHITWSVNSLTHLFGYTNYKTDDHSRNNWFVALLSVGEGWHNNHHSDPLSASNQHRWWEFDLTYYEIKLLERLGLATDVIPPKHIRHAGRKTESLDEAPSNLGS